MSELYIIIPAMVISVVAVIYFVYQQEQKRIAEFEVMAAESGTIYHGKQSDKAFRYQVLNSGHKLFRKGHHRRVKHLFEQSFSGGWMAVFEYEYRTENGNVNNGNNNDSTHTYHAILIESDKLPFTSFSVEREGLRHQIKPKLGLKTKDIDFEMYPEFSNRFFLRGEDETAVRDLFSDTVIRWFEGMTHGYKVGLLPPTLLLYSGGKLRADEVEIHKRNGLAFYEMLIGQKSAESKWGSEHDW